jgi:hypothetical protein
MMISGGVFAAIDWSSLAAGSEVTVSEAETVNDSDMAKINACSLLTLAHLKQNKNGMILIWFS